MLTLENQSWKRLYSTSSDQRTKADSCTEDYRVKIFSVVFDFGFGRSVYTRGHAQRYYTSIYIHYGPRERVSPLIRTVVALPLRARALDVRDWNGVSMIGDYKLRKTILCYQIQNNIAGVRTPRRSPNVVLYMSNGSEGDRNLILHVLISSHRRGEHFVDSTRNLASSNHQRSFRRFFACYKREQNIKKKDCTLSLKRRF